MRRHSRGVSLIMVLISVVLMTLLVVGAVTFTGSERSASAMQGRAQQLSGCTQAVRNLFLANVQVLQSNVGSVNLNQLVGNAMKLQTAHFTGSAQLQSVERLAASGSYDSVNDISNRAGPSGLLRGDYRITGLCKTGSSFENEEEVEFVVSLGL